MQNISSASPLLLRCSKEVSRKPPAYSFCLKLVFYQPTWLVSAFIKHVLVLIGRSLKHVKTGKCIHTNGAWPGVGRNMVLWSGCNEQRLELWFMKQGKFFSENFPK